MKKCIQLARRAIGNVSPNPMVGSIIVYNGEIIGKGYHKYYGKEHAEVNAINNVKDKSLLNKSTLYVNLEPCSHYGNTPPCANYIIKNNIPKVVVGCIDPSSKVAGKGISAMRKQGIIVDVGILENECRILNKRFFKYQEEKRPYIILKWAQSQDGFIAPKNQKKAFWMTSKKSKNIVHKWRSEEDTILIGRITAEKDNPQLTVRNNKGNNPTRLLIDPDLKVNPKSNIYNSEAKTIIFNNKISKNSDSKEFIYCESNNMINSILNSLYKRKVISLIIEGGHKTLQSFIDAKMWDEARVFTANTKLKDGIPAPIINGNIVKEQTIEDDKLELILKA